MANPFWHGIDDRLRGRHVFVRQSDGTVVSGYLDRVHHGTEAVHLRDASIEWSRDDDEPTSGVGDTYVSDVDMIAAEGSPDRWVERVAIDDVDPAPYHERSFSVAENERFIETVAETGFVDSYPVVRTKRGGKYEIVAGHKRIWACRQAGLAYHPVEVVEGLDDERAACRHAATHFRTYTDDEIRRSIETMLELLGESVLQFDVIAHHADRLGMTEDEPAPAADGSSTEFDLLVEERVVVEEGVGRTLGFLILRNDISASEYLGPDGFLEIDADSDEDRAIPSGVRVDWEYDIREVEEQVLHDTMFDDLREGLDAGKYLGPDGPLEIGTDAGGDSGPDENPEPSDDTTEASDDDSDAGAQDGPDGDDGMFVDIVEVRDYDTPTIYLGSRAVHRLPDEVDSVYVEGSISQNPIGFVEPGSKIDRPGYTISDNSVTLGGRACEYLGVEAGDVLAVTDTGDTLALHDVTEPPKGLAEADVHAVAEVCETIPDAAENMEISPDYARHLFQAHGCLDEFAGGGWDE